MAVSVSTQSCCTTHCTEANYPKYKHIFSLFFIHFTRLGFIAPSGEVPLQSRHLHSGSLQVIGLSEIGLDFCGAGEWGDGGLWKGIPLEPSLSRTHLSARDTTPLPGLALSAALESGVSKEVHSYPGSEWSHNTQPTGVYDPSPKLDIVAIGKSTEAESTYLNVEALFSLSSLLLISSLISTAMKYEAILHLRLASRGRVPEDQQV